MKDDSKMMDFQLGAVLVVVLCILAAVIAVLCIPVLLWMFLTTGGTCA
jgi:hypothetical protein